MLKSSASILVPLWFIANHRDLQPLVVRELAQSRETMHRRAMTDDDLLRFGFEDAVLPAFGVGRPCRHVLVVQQHDVEVFGVGELAQLIDLGLRIHAFARGHLRHQPVGIARDALQRNTEHPVHVAVGFGGFEKANPAVVSVAHQRVNSSCPSSRWVCPLNVPVPKASRVTFTPDLPRVTQSVAVPPAARRGKLPVPASVAAKPVFRKLRREQCAISSPPIAFSLLLFSAVHAFRRGAMDARVLGEGNYFRLRSRTDPAARRRIMFLGINRAHQGLSRTRSLPG